MMGWGGFSGQGWRKGPWTPEEDKLLTEYVSSHGEGRWSSVSKCSGLNRNGKSCRLRWVNYLRPGLKRGHITPQEEGIIIELHALWGNKWSTIARYLPGRTDNEIKNYWRTHFKKKGKEAAAAGVAGEGSNDKQEKIKFHRRRNRKPEGEDHDDDGIPSLQEETIINNNASVSPHSEVITAGDNIPISDMIITSLPPSPETETPQQEEEGFNQCYFPATYHNEIFLARSSTPSSDSAILNPVDGLWGWLWNIDDQINWRGDFTKTGFQNQANYGINNNGECIF